MAQDHPTHLTGVSLIQRPATPCPVASVPIFLLNHGNPASVLFLTTSQAHVCKYL